MAKCTIYVMTVMMIKPVSLSVNISSLLESQYNRKSLSFHLMKVRFVCLLLLLSSLELEEEKVMTRDNVEKVKKRKGISYREIKGISDVEG